MTNMGERNRARLSVMARQRGLATNLLLIRFVMERFLARLSKSSHGSSFALKGALLMTIWNGDFLRTTSDVDLHGMNESNSGRMLDIIRDICLTISDENDGLEFAPGAAVWKPLVGGRLGGDRVTVPVSIGNAHCQLKVDVGFGHPVTPGFEMRWYPSLFPEHLPFCIACYPRETVIAEKLAVAVEFGKDNTRLRDYWDIHSISSTYSFGGHGLVDAVRATFDMRDAGKFITRDDEYWRGALRPEFASPALSKAWCSWLQNHCPSSKASFDQTLTSVTGFAIPLLQALRYDGRLPGYWSPGIGWSRKSRASDLRYGSCEERAATSF